MSIAIVKYADIVEETIFQQFQQKMTDMRDAYNFISFIETVFSTST